ncbi:MAG: hypothetical protein ABSB35_41825 [Bryobacteraceae bacterium]|jgi:hypothetical protein
MGTTRNPASGREVEMGGRDVEMSGRDVEMGGRSRGNAESSLDALRHFFCASGAIRGAGPPGWPALAGSIRSSRSRSLAAIASLT